MGLYNRAGVRSFGIKPTKFNEGGEAVMEAPRRPNSQLQAGAEVPGVPLYLLLCCQVESPLTV